MLTLKRSPKFGIAALLVVLALIASACSGDAAAVSTEDAAPATSASLSEGSPTTETKSEMAKVESEPITTVRESGLTVIEQAAGYGTVHSVVSPEEVFANATHIIETKNSLVIFDTQLLLPNALDFRAYADSLDKPIEAVFITHEHPDHFLGTEAFDDVPIYAIAEVVEAIEANGDEDIEQQTAVFGPDAIASTFVVPEVVEPGTMEIDGVAFELETVADAEAEFQLVTRIPEGGVIVTGDIIYSGVHLGLFGSPDTWITAIEGLAADSDDYPIVLAGHGVPTDPSVYDENIAWLTTASELLETATTGEEFKQGLLDEYPELGLEVAIDLVIPDYFPEG